MVELKAILASTIDIVDQINEYVLSIILGEEKKYLSSNSIDKSDVSNIEVVNKYHIYSEDVNVSLRNSIAFQAYKKTIPFSCAITINKSQGQSLESVRLYVPKPVFSHGQLYVAISRVKSKKGLKILIYDKDGNPLKSTINVVYKKVFQNL
ncbi:hypothetical protein Lal_00022217 [Lupinus albus]|nr:hypothetical protein Lal_00022217 [Lupinus albus]